MRLTQAEFASLLKSTGTTIVDGDDENDNVINTGLSFKRVDVYKLAQAIHAMAVNPLSILGASPAVYRNGSFYLDGNLNRNWNNTSGGDFFASFGNAGDLPIAGDWNGDGIDQIGVVRKGTWYLDTNGNRKWDGVAGGDQMFLFGAMIHTPVVGDWNDDGKAQMACSVMERGISTPMGMVDSTERLVGTECSASESRARTCPRRLERRWSHGFWCFLWLVRGISI